jgi:hypothetical protein
MTKVTEIVIAEIGGKTEVLYTHERRPCMAERDRIEKIKQKRKKESEMLKYDSRYKNQSGNAIAVTVLFAGVLLAVLIMLVLLAPAIGEVIQEMQGELDPSKLSMMMGAIV